MWYNDTVGIVESWDDFLYTGGTFIERGHNYAEKCKMDSGTD